MGIPGHGWARLPAFRAYPQKLQLGIEDLKAPRILHELIRVSGPAEDDVFQGSTANTSNVVVRCGRMVKAPLDTGQIQTLDGSLRRQSLEIPVHRPQADPGKLSLHALINFIRRRMRSGCAKLIQNHASLDRHAGTTWIRQRFALQVSETHY
jgi:hypothetical protein